MVYLASGFKEIDEFGDSSTFSNCLRFLQSLEFFRNCKMKSFELLDLGAGLVVLDLGSGLGEDAIAMGRLVAPEGWVVGVDFSRSMIERVLPAIVRGKSLRLPYDGFWEALTPRKTYGP